MLGDCEEWTRLHLLGISKPRKVGVISLSLEPGDKLVTWCFGPRLLYLTVFVVFILSSPT